MNNNMNEQNNQGMNNTFPNASGTFANNSSQPTNQSFTNNNINQPVNPPYNQTFTNNNFDSNNNLNQNNFNNINTPNYVPNNNVKNNKTKKIIMILAIVLGIVVVILILVNLLLKSPNNDSNKNNQQNQINTNKNENIIENQEQSNDYKDDEVKNNEEQITNGDTYIENTNIIKRSLGQTSTFDNGISINITNSIEYADDEGIYHKPIFIKVEISNGSTKNFYQGTIGHPTYKMYTENPVEFNWDDFNHTNFEIVPMYLIGDKLKTESCGCVLRKNAYIDVIKSDGQGRVLDVNYIVVKPGEKTTAYLLCYFREKIEGAKINTIYLLKKPNEFMYFMD